MENIKKTRIRKINIISNEDVYDITIKDNHNFFANNILVHNCGEIPLAAGDACRLMSLNLYSYVNKPFTPEASFDYNKLIEHGKLSIKLMDNMIDLENEKIDKILAKIEDDPEDGETKTIERNLWHNVKRMNNAGRRSGIGFTGLADMLAALNLKYGTVEATNFVQDIQQILATSIYVGSCDLVQIDNRSKFECFDYNLEKDNPFLNRLCGERLSSYSNVSNIISKLANEFYSKWNKGRRNIALLTCAPVGSLSTQSQTSSGLEPVFMISYRRRRKIDKTSNIKADFIDKTGDAFIEFNVVHNKFIEWYRITHEMTFNDAKEYLESLSVDELNKIIETSPYYSATAMDCDWHERINMQAALQRYVDHSLSVTCNLPKGTPEDVVEDVYRTAWESGCKGCTIYVDGCRDGVLINKDEKKECDCKQFAHSTAPKRPKKLPCQIMRFNNRGTKWIAVVGLYEDKPYEIFTGVAERFDIPTNIKDGFIVRNKVNKDVIDEDTNEMKTIQVSRYDVEYINDRGEVAVAEGLSTVFNPEYFNYGKLISGLMRHGMPANYISKVVASLDFKDEGISTWKNGIIRALKPYTQDEKTGDKCPKCGAELWRVSGCIQCPDCGWSKCG
jgi:ribonucleoside-diphosphate reductase alpha chain